MKALRHSGKTIDEKNHIENGRLATGHTDFFIVCHHYTTFLTGSDLYRLVWDCG